MSEKAKRYAIFAIGLFINSLGVSFITTADLGTSPISSIPYVLSLNAPLSLGQFTILFNLLIVLVQLPILKKQFQWEHWLQVPVTLLFGWFIDLTMVPLAAIAPQTYLWKLGFLLLGCLILGFGVYLEMAANVAMLPGESFVRAVSTTWHRDFGLTKIVFDVSMSLTAAGLSLVLAHTLDGVREGTLIAALLVGLVARTCRRVQHRLQHQGAGQPVSLFDQFGKGRRFLMKAQGRLIRVQQRALTDLDVQRQSAIRHAQRVGNVQAAAAVQRCEHIQFRPDRIFFR